MPPMPPPTPPPPLPQPPAVPDDEKNDNISTGSAEARDGSKVMRKVRRIQHPQKEIDLFWEQFNSKFPGKAFNLLPKKYYERRKRVHTAASASHRAQSQSHDTNSSASATAAATATETEEHAPEDNPAIVATSTSASASYDQAVAACKAKVAKIKQECERNNQKYRDLSFDIESDLDRDIGDCLKHLDQLRPDFGPGSVRRIPEIFDEPQFYIDGATATDVKQGNDGNCWLLAAICALCHNVEAMKQICISQEPKVGVYGFVFHRDGEWFPEVVDDKLYLIKPSYNNLSPEERIKWNELSRKSPEDDWREQNQKGSGALYFASCKHPQETWLPLLEKAYAKAHNDYAATNGGFFGEAIEDLTGGMTSEVSTSDILDKDKFWTEELMQVNEKFFFGCATGHWSPYEDNQGIQFRHAYSILEAREARGRRLLKLRNPWGRIEWQGPWSDGSEEWTVDWINELKHKFGDDGIFWISYEDFLRKFTNLDRTRLFGPEWQVTQLWTALSVPWAADYLDTKFRVTLKKKTSVVFVLSQLDQRYFYGLEGPYKFQFHFRVQKEDEEDDYIIRSRPNVYMKRSTSAELNDLEAGTYIVCFKILATRVPQWAFPQDVIKRFAKTKREKLLRVAFQYDYAHTKARFKETEKMRKEQEEARKRRQKSLQKGKEKEWRKKLKLRARRRQEKDILDGLNHDRRVHHILPGMTAPVIRERIDRPGIKAGDAEGDFELPAAQQPFPSSPMIDIRERVGRSKVKESDVADDGRRSETPQPFPISPLESKHSDVGGEFDSKFPNQLFDRKEERKSESRKQSVGSISVAPTNASEAVNGTDAPSKPGEAIKVKQWSNEKPEKKLMMHDISDSEASWDSDVDGPWDLPRKGADGHNRRHTVVDDVDLSGDDRFETDIEPWNAVCVLGLRVYSENTEDGDVRVELIRPDLGQESESEEEKLGEQESTGDEQDDFDKRVNVLVNANDMDGPPHDGAGESFV